MAMTTLRWMVTTVLLCSLAVGTTGCRKWFSKSNKGTTGGVPGGGTEGIYETRLDKYDESSLKPRDSKFDTGPVIAAGQFDTVRFAFDSAQVETTERAKVESVAEFLKSNASALVTLEGHCDERGSAEYNVSLGERRALAVRDYLMTLGIDGARIQTKSFGAERPKDPGHDETAWSVNRRVEFVIVK
jgi:peptidoglycan-associated lipoprotein